MLRAVQTAQKIGDMINLEPQIIIELHEKCRIHTVAPRKRIEGLKKAKILRLCPTLLKTVTEEGWQFHQFHNKRYSSWDAFRSRSCTF